MTLRSLFKTVEKLAVDNSPTLISAFAVTGTLTTAFLTGKATFKAAEILAEKKREDDFREINGPELTKKDMAKLVWKEYIPPAIAVVGTIGCIITANSISSARLAGLAAAYKLTEKQYVEYKDKVIEKLGLQDEKRMRDELNEERVRKNPPSDDIQMLATEDEVLFLEAWTGRYFRSKMHIIKAAENTINRSLIHDNYATLSDFYDEIGLARTQESSEVGWSLDNPISLDFTSTIADGGTRPCIVMEYSNLPTPIKSIRPGYGSEAGYLGVH